MSFEEFIEAVCSIPDEKAEAHYMSQYLYITDNGGNVLVDFIGRHETFEKDFSHICNRIGAKKPELSHLMKSNHETYRKYYTKETSEMVKQRYLKDISMFGYEFWFSKIEYVNGLWSFSILDTFSDYLL